MKLKENELYDVVIIGGGPIGLACGIRAKKAGLKYVRQHGIKLIYDEIEMDIGFRADIIMDNNLIVEIKSVEHLEKVHHKTLLTYLK